MSGHDQRDMPDKQVRRGTRAAALEQPGHRDDEPAELPAAGSRAALRLRLERLPFGHPSSPYHVDGEPKPPPPRLRHLELAPPAAAPAAGRPAHPARAEAADPAGSETAIFAAIDPALADGPRTDADGTWHWGPAALSQVQVRIAEDAYDRFCAMEGRNLFGDYGDSALTTAMRQVEALLEHGQLVPGTQQHALLDRDKFRAAFAELIRRHPDRAPEQLARRVPGALTYSFVFDAPHYSAGLLQVQDLLQARGFRLEARRNSWGDQQNRRVITMWLDPVRGLPFQVQFHTGASIEAQQLTRTSAPLLSDPRIPEAEAASLRSDLAAAWAAVPAPPGNSSIGDYSRAASGQRR